MVLRHVRAVVRIELVLRDDRVGVLEAFALACLGLGQGRGRAWHRRSTDRALVDLPDAVRKPFVLAALAREDVEEPLLKVVPWRPGLPIVWLCQVLDIDCRHWMVPGGCTTL